ncbi:MAG: class I SAM-dependent methyltransferase, partial [Planctomycetota bacterium]
MSTRNTRAISRRLSNKRPLRKDIPASAPDSYRHLFLNHKGKVSDKWEHYLSVYELELRPMVALGAPLQLLEIGVQNGGSLEIWKKFLPEGSSIVGIDVDSRCKKLQFPANIELHIADAADPEALRCELGDRQFDIIVDDGSHQQADILSTFRSLFSRLKFGGKYLIEDLHASYWSSHGGAYLKPDTAIEYFKNLIDAQNVDYIQGDIGDVGLSREELQQFGADIGRVSFYDSIFVVEKYARRKSAPFRRLITGRKMGVTPLLSYVDAMADAPASIVMVGPIREDGLGAVVGELNRTRSELAELKLHIAQVAEESTEVGDPSARAEAEALRADLSRLGDAHAALSGDLSKLHEELAVRASSVEQLQGALRDRATELEAATHQLAARDARVLELEAAANSSSSAIAELEAQVAEKASSVEQLQGALRDRATEL